MNNKLLKKTKWLVYGAILCVTGLVLAIGMIAPESIKAVSGMNLNQSLIFIVIRLSLYAVVYFKWGQIVRSFNPDINDTQIQRSRKSVAMVMAVYEVFVGFNVFKLLGV